MERRELELRIELLKHQGVVIPRYDIDTPLRTLKATLDYALEKRDQQQMLKTVRELQTTSDLICEKLTENQDKKTTQILNFLTIIGKNYLEANASIDCHKHTDIITDTFNMCINEIAGKTVRYDIRKHGFDKCPWCDESFSQNEICTIIKPDMYHGECAKNIC